ncbi:MAG: proline--tRNA ligase [Deltaproteobacteria bacterium]|nr:proline--tRNA ligase [Deltaproteobacteria bacterium]MBI4373611.1 proline--tRNA ligase [Deltaproteobacteria bacterium]
MLFSKSFIPTLREAPADAEVISHQLMLRAGMIRKVASGIYNYLPLGLCVIQKVSNIIREEMNAAGAQELLMPMVQPKELWEESGRWGEYGKELLRFKDRHEREFCLGPTHEEVITTLVRNEVRSYRQLPVTLYQIQTKFRDEIRPRFGLMRGREFLMKDCYSFDRDELAAKESYRRMFEAYKKIFGRCGVEFRPVEAGTGLIGGTLSHEFHVLASSGEDEIFACSECDYAASAEKVAEGKRCPECKIDLRSFRGIEVGQVFYLGTKYSRKLHAVYLNPDGKEQMIEMGCYGIGVGRTAAASIEQNHDDHGIVWPLPIAPYAVEIIPLAKENPEVKELAEKFYNELQKERVDVLLDDRDESPGVKFKDADLIGIPWRIQIGPKGLVKGEVEIKCRRTGEISLVKKEQAVFLLKEKISDLR